MANIAGNMAWDLDDPGDIFALKSYLGIDKALTTEDFKLEQWFNTAIEKGDLYLDNDFTDDDGNDITFPETVRLGVWEYVKSLKERHEKEAGLKSVRTGQLAEAYAFDGNGAMIALASAIHFWFCFKSNPLLGGAM